jgi:hypothetical protein
MSEQAWTIGDYIVDPTPFDRGEFGMVYNARRRGDGRRVALKLVLSTPAPDSADKLAAERRGAELQQQFARAHGMVPQVYEFGPHQGCHFFIAMEFVDGGSLAQLIAKGPMAPRAAAQYAARICDFLDKAHGFLTIEGAPGNAIVHADLKPQHILLPGPDEIRVLDFGIAKALAKTRQVTTNIWGTLYYAAPEQLESGGVNPHVDFWSLGVMLYEMVAGHRPYSQLEGNKSRLEQAIRGNDRREPLPDACPRALAAIINKLLAYQPDRRYPTASAIKEDLDAFLCDTEPAAAAEFDVPATIAIDRPAPPAQTSPLPDVVTPTDPLPAVQQTRATASVPAPLTGRRDVTRGVLRRVVWLAVLLSMVGVLATEGVAWVAAERFRDALEAIEGRNVTERRGEYDRIRGWSIFDLALRWRVDEPLRQRLTAIGDAVLADYRREEPTVGPAEWRQAADALRWALELSPDAATRAKQIDCEAHVARIAAQGHPRGSQLRRQLFLSAIGKFRQAAALDPDSFDPYLGISRTQVYGFDDVDAAAIAIAEAEKRGYQSRRRERAQLGDGYLRRGERSRRLARALSGEQRVRELENAHAAYARCIELFDPIIGFGNAAHNLEFCKRRLDLVADALDSAHDHEP